MRNSLSKTTNTQLSPRSIARSFLLRSEKNGLCFVGEPVEFSRLQFIRDYKKNQQLTLALQKSTI